MALSITSMNVHRVKTIKLSRQGEASNWFFLELESGGNELSNFAMNIFVDSAEIPRYTRAVEAFNAALELSGYEEPRDEVKVGGE